MQKTILVKDITNLSEARYCAGMFVDMLSFNFDENHDFYIEKNKFTEIRNWLSGIKILGSANSFEDYQINNCIKDYNLDGFIFTENQISFLEKIKCVIKIVEIKSENLTKEIHDSLFNVCDFIVIVNENEHYVFENVNNYKNILIGYNFNSIQYNYEQVNGFAFLGSIELKPGLSNYNNLIDSLEYLDEKSN